MLLKFEITILLMILVTASLGSRFHDTRDFFETESEKNSASSISVTDNFQDVNDFFETENEKKSRSSNESDNFHDAEDFFEVESWEPVTLQASETSLTTSK